MRNTNVKTLRNRFLRRRGIWIASLIAVVCAVTVNLGFEWTLRRGLEMYASRVNGALVSIQSVQISLLKGKGALKGIAVTNHAQTMRNLLEVDEIRFHFRRRPLLSLKLIIPSMHVEGIRYNTPREISGLPNGIAQTYSSTAILDRVSHAYDPIQAALGQSPLRNLGLLSLGLGARNTVELMHRELETHQRLKTLENEWDRLLTTWEQAAGRLLPSSEGSAGETQRAQTLLAKVDWEYASLANRLEKATGFIASDIKRVLRRLGLPDLASEDFTRELLGRRTLNHLERLSYWVDLSRRRLGVGLGNEPLTYPSQASALGAEVRFPTPDSLPRFAIHLVRIHSEAGDHPHQGNVDGTISDLSSERGVDYRPLQLDFKAEFPGLRIFGLRAHALLDHGRKEPRDLVELSVGSFPLTDWTVEQSPDLMVTVDSRVASLAFRSDFQGATLSADWSVNVRDAEFKVTSRHRPLENTLRDIFEPLSTSVQVSGSVSGSAPGYDFRVQSNVGRKLAVAVGDRFRLPMNAAEEAIREELQDRFAPAITKLRVRAQNGHTQVASRLLEHISAATH